MLTRGLPRFPQININPTSVFSMNTKKELFSLNDVQKFVEIQAPQIEKVIGEKFGKQVLVTGTIDMEKVMQFQDVRPTHEVMIEHLGMFLMPNGVERVLEEYGLSNATADVNGETIHIRSIEDLCNVFKMLEYEKNKNGHRGGGFRVGSEVIYKNAVYIVNAVNENNRYGIVSKQQFDAARNINTGSQVVEIISAGESELTIVHGPSSVIASGADSLSSICKLFFSNIFYILFYLGFATIVTIIFLNTFTLIKAAGSKSMLTSGKEFVMSNEFQTLYNAQNMTEIVKNLQPTTIKEFGAITQTLINNFAITVNGMAANAQPFAVSVFTLFVSTCFDSLIQISRILLVGLPSEVKNEIFIDSCKKLVQGILLVGGSAISLSVENSNWWGGLGISCLSAGLMVASGGTDILGAVGLVATGDPVAKYKKSEAQKEAKREAAEKAAKKEAKRERERRELLEAVKGNKEAEVIVATNSYEDIDGGSRMRKPMRKTRRKPRSNRRRRASRNKK